MRIPKKISPSPIVEAVVEIRFENELPSEVLFGKLYGALGEEFSQTEQLPILQMPAQFRDSQPELKFAPHYRLKNDDYLVNIGQRMVSVNRLCVKNEYDGWDTYFEIIKRVFTTLQEKQILTTADSATVRFINYIDKKIPEALELEVGLLEKKIEDYSDLTLNISLVADESTKVNILLSSNAKVESGGHVREGLVVNVEATKTATTPITELAVTVEDLHAEVEKAFFGSLRKEYIESLNPEYAD